jgi:hypothetical protein
VQWVGSTPRTMDGGTDPRIKLESRPHDSCLDWISKSIALYFPGRVRSFE